MNPTTSKMKLSESIRLGALIRPQAFGHTFVEGKSCALAAALEASGVKPEDLVATFAVSPWHLWDISSNKSVGQVSCPLCGEAFQVGVVSMVVHLNDDHKWTREKIADWVEGIEDLFSALTAPEVTDAAKS